MSAAGAEVRARVHDFLLGRLAPRGVKSLTDDEPLTESGALDSLGVFQLVAFVEQAFALRIGDDEITAENFGTLGAVTLLIAAKLDGRRTA